MRFHGNRPAEVLGVPEITIYLSTLATRFRVSPSTQNQALSALLFLYRDVLRVQLTGLDQIVRARRPARLPVVLTRDEVKALLSHLHGKNWLLASLLYGAGLRLLECLRLRIKDIDFTRNEILVRDGKGRKDRVTLLPQKIKKPLLAHIQRVQKQHQRDLENGVGSVQLPYAIERKYPRALWE